jgi:phage-related protein
MGITSGIAHFFESIGETIHGIFAAILHIFQLVFSTVMGVFHGCVNFVEGTLGFAFRKFLVPFLAFLPCLPLYLPHFTVPI